MAQVVTFQKNYDVDGTSDSGYYMTLDETGFVLGGGTLCKFGNQELGCDGLLKVDSLGNLIWKKVYHTFPYSFDGRKIKVVFDNGYLLCGSAFSVNGFRPFLMKLDNNGDSLWLRFYEDSLMRKAGDFKLKNNGKILVYGAGSIATNYQHAFVMQTNASGEKEWVKAIDVNSPQYRGGDFSLLENEDLVFGYKSSPLENFNHTLALTRTDSIGNVLWTKTYQTNENDYCNAYMTPLHNGGFTLGYCDPNWDVGDILLHLFGTDSLGNLEWDYVFPKRSPSLRRLITASNGDIIGCGIQSVEGDDGGEFGWLFRMTQDGELLWKRAYRPDQSVPINIISELNDLVETPDGGIAAIGTMMDSLPDGSGWGLDVWLLKVAADGCFTPGCTDSILTAAVEPVGGIFKSERQVFFRLSPNPVSGQAKLAFYNQAPKNAAVRVFNAQGRPVREVEVPPGSGETVVDFSGQPPGLYSIVFEIEGQIVQAEKIVKL